MYSIWRAESKLSDMLSYCLSMGDTCNPYPFNGYSQDMYQAQFNDLFAAINAYKADVAAKTTQLRDIITSDFMHTIVDGLSYRPALIIKPEAPYPLGYDDYWELFSMGGLVNDIIDAPVSYFYEGCIIRPLPVPIPPLPDPPQTTALLQAAISRASTGEASDAFTRNILLTFLRNYQIINSLRYLTENFIVSGHPSYKNEVGKEIYITKHAAEIINHLALDVYKPTYVDYTPEEYFTTDILDWYSKITDYNNEGGIDVNIPDSINYVTPTHIGSSAFANKQLISVIMSKQITTIESNAFVNNQLVSVDLLQIDSISGNSTNKLTTIYDNAFANNRLSSIIFPDSLIRIGYGAFENNQLVSISLTNITELGSKAFKNNKLTSVILPNAITVIYASVFENNQLTSATLGSSITHIDDDAFANNKLLSIIFPNSLNEIRLRAFANNKFGSLVLPDSIEYIYADAFKGNLINSITIGEGVIFRDMYGVEMTTTNNHIFGEYSPGFCELYFNNGRLAGTYEGSETWTKTA